MELLQSLLADTAKGDGGKDGEGDAVDCGDGCGDGLCQGCEGCDEGGDEADGVEVEIGTEEIEEVNDALHAKLAELAGSEAADQELLRPAVKKASKRKRGTQEAEEGMGTEEEEASRRLSVAMYREGLREVLTDAIVAIEEMVE